LTIVIKIVIIKLMKLSTKIRYASRLLLALAEADRKISTSELGKLLGVSPLYLRNIALQLEKNGLIKSTRGSKGGYELAKSPSEISIYKLAQIYGDLELVECLQDAEICGKSSKCKARKLWLKLKNCIETFMKKVTIKDLLEGNIDEYILYEKEAK